MSSYHSPSPLPEPSAEQIAHSQRLIECIVEHINRSGGVISFADYMQHCLYEAGLGYYSAGAQKFGASGDFVTAPELSPLFSRTLARFAASLFDQGLSSQVLEIGAGSGRLCLDMIEHWQQQGVEWDGYLILETSPDLQQRQRQLLAQQLDQPAMRKIHWLSEWPRSFNGLVLGNEVLDAMPLHVVLKQVQWQELGVAFDGERFQWREFSADSDAVQRMHIIDADNQLPPDYCTEVNLLYEPWCQGLAQACDQAVVLLIDYGYEQAQYYHPARVSGTLQCFYQHRVHPDPFVYPGLQDITAFVDFDAFADAALNAGFMLDGLTTQAEFLMQNGLLELADLGSDDPMQQLAQAQQVKTLTLPAEMGEKFKVIGLHKNLELKLIGLNN